VKILQVAIVQGALRYVADGLSYFSHFSCQVIVNKKYIFIFKLLIKDAQAFLVNTSPQQQLQGPKFQGHNT